MIYQFVVPEMISPNQNEPPILTGRHLAISVINCPIKGDRTVLDACENCEYKKEISYHFVDCNCLPSQSSSPGEKRTTQPKNMFSTKK